jgi:tetratricopeptide (TPR) repeat protein
VAEATQDLEAALGAYQQAEEIYTRLAEADPADVDAASNAARILTLEGAVLIESDRPSDAWEQLGRARREFASLIARNDTADVRNGYATTLQLLCRLCVRLDDRSAALSQIQEAIVVAGRRTPSLLRDLAMALHVNGDTDGAIGVAQEAMLSLAGRTLSLEETRLLEKLQVELAAYRSARGG